MMRSTSPIIELPKNPPAKMSANDQDRDSPPQQMRHEVGLFGGNRAAAGEGGSVLSRGNNRTASLKAFFDSQTRFTPSQLSIPFAKHYRALDVSACVEDTNLSRTKARS